MQEKNHIISPENMGTWVAATFIIALLALALSIWQVNRTNELTARTLALIMQVNSKIEGGGTAAAPDKTPDTAQQEAQ